MSSEKIIPYVDIEPKLGTFDIINCAQKDIFWRLIGHSAVVYSDPLTKMLFCLESTSISKISGIQGVQMNPLGLWLDNYPGKVYVRQCRAVSLYADGFVRSGKPEAFIEKYRTSSYPNIHTRSGRWKLIMSALDINLFGRDIAQWKGGDNGIFCTELVVLFLRWCGVMRDLGLPAYEFEPDDFRKKDISGYMAAGITYSSEIRIK